MGKLTRQYLPGYFHSRPPALWYRKISHMVM
jgi:hypothetical protein